MKKINKYIFTLAALALASTACVKEAEYEKGPQEVEGCYGVYFPAQEASGSHTFDPSQPTEIEFTVARTNPDGDITVPVKHTASHEGVFQLGELSFVDGEVETTLKVTFPDSEIGPTYKLSLSIEDPQYASIYSDKSTRLDFSVMRVEWKYVLNPQTNQPAEFTFTQTWWDEEHTGKVKYYEIDGVRTCQTETDPYEYSDGTGYGFWGTGDAPGEGELEFTWYPAKKLDDEGTKELVELPLSPVWEHADLGMVYAFDAYWFAYLTGATEDEYVDYAMKNKENSNYYSNGQFSFYIAYYLNMQGSGWPCGEWDVTLDAEGYIRTDYSLSLKAGQSMAGKLPVIVNAGTDVAKVKYAVFEGELYAAGIAKNVDGIIAGTVESAEVTAEQLAENPVIDVTMEETGVYTLVAVTYDKDGKAQKNGSVSFSYVAADDNVPVVVSVGLGSADKYVPTGVKTDNALEYWVYGKDLQSVKMGFFSAQDLAKGEQECFAKVAASAAVDAETLEVINAEGYVSVVEKLNPGTEYFLLVVATNGYETKLLKSEGFYTTGTPHPVYMNFSMADIQDELCPAASSEIFGTYNYYARTTDENGILSDARQYLGQITVADSETPDTEPDEYGLPTEFVNMTGFIPYAAQIGLEQTMEVEFYDGVIYASGMAAGTFQGLYTGLFPGDEETYTYNAYLLGGFVQEGYLAFVNMYEGQGVNINGFILEAYEDEAFQSYYDYIDMFFDILLVDPAKDDSGLVPDPEAPATAQLKQIAKSIRRGPANYVETPSDSIRSIIDKARNTPVLRGQLTDIMGQRDVKAVSFKAEASSAKIMKSSKNESFTKVAGITLR